MDPEPRGFFTFKSRGLSFPRFFSCQDEFRRHLKNRILFQDRGGAEFQTGGILLYVEDLKRGTNPAEKGGRPKDIFEMASDIFMQAKGDGK